ncbi:MAG: SurA N-terminal domain-containing protein [bacterium]|nr:SurA N-terminal domain-containing protein [bacterium]
MVNKRRRRHARGPGIVATLRDPKKIRVVYIIAGIALVFGGSLGFGASKCDRGRPTPINPVISQPTDVIAKVADHEITYYEYNRDYEMALRNADQSQDTTAVLHPPEYNAETGYRVLRQMIDMEYFDIRATEQGLTVSDTDVDAKMEEYRKMLLPPQPVNEDRSLLERLSEAFQSVKTDKAFAERLQQLDPTMTPARLREITYQELVAQQYVAQLQAKYQTEIMTELSSEANTLRDQIIGGLDFAEAARNRSDHEASKAAGGLVPMVKHNSTDLPQPVIESSFSLPIDEISLPIVVTDAENRGVWLVKVTSRKEASGDDWLAARDEIGARLLDEKRQQVDQGTIEMPEDGNLVVSEEEKINDYEEADIRIIYFKAEDPMSRVQKFVLDDEATMNIIINDPSLRAMSFEIQQEWEPASLSYYDALKVNAAKFNAEQDNQYAVDMEEGNIRYLLGYLWMSRAFSAESEWLQGLYQLYQQNPDAFGGEFPETPESIKADQQGYFVLALANFNRAIEIEDMGPWSHVARAQIDLRRELVSMRVIQDIETAYEFSSKDLQLEQRIASLLQQLISEDDKALIKAGDVRPEVWADPVLPEDELDITLAGIDAPFNALLATTDFLSLQAPKATATPADEASSSASSGEIEPVIGTDGSAAETEPVTDEADALSTETVEGSNLGDIEGSSQENTEGTPPETPGWLPIIGIPEPTGPLTQELRDRVQSLFDVVQASVDELTALQQAAQQQQQALQQQQFDQLPVNPSEEGAPPSEGADNLLIPAEETPTSTQP